jgi:hypothetical protein
VWTIRKFQPDVIITRFPTTGEGGHGHHTASAILANEAFTASADPKRFPEQLIYVQPWQAKRIVLNGFNFGNAGTRTDGLRMDVGGFNPILGKSYGEIAAESRSQHKSQGFGSAGSRGEALEYFMPTGGPAPVNDLLEGVETSWQRLPNTGLIQSVIDSITRSFDFMQPQNSVKGLVRLYKVISAMSDQYWKTQKLKEVQKLIEQSSGLWADVFTSEAYAVQTDSTRINFSFNNRSGIDMRLQSISIDAFDTTLSQTLPKNKNVNFSQALFVPLTKPITQPYWLQQQMKEGYFNVNDQQWIGVADIQPAYTAKINLEIEGQTFVLNKPIRYRFTDPVRGELYQPFVVLPPATFSELQAFYLKNKKDNSIEANVKAYKSLVIPASKGPVARPDNDTPLLLAGPYSLNKNQIASASFSIGTLADKTYGLSTALDNKVGQQVTTINYDHIPTINYFTEAVTSIKNLDLKIVGKRIGYIVGAGDKVPQALEQMGYDVVLLGDKDLARNNLTQYNAIITGVRAYNTNEFMNKYYDRLMKYVEDGGNLIVQYNTSTQIGPIRAKISPYPFNISRTRVTDENATVRFLNPTHPALTFPNVISENDFKGWVQERSTYHAADFDKNFTPLLSMNDPGEAADNGSLIVAKYGKGYFTYAGLVFFRQLPAGVPGAFRLMANLIALNYKKSF